LEASTAHLKVNGSDYCLNTSSAASGATIVSSSCAADMSMSWEFVDTAAVAQRCIQLCGQEIFDIWSLINN
ncbi:unnamed protein product, partial [Effrenium voratum]